MDIYNAVWYIILHAMAFVFAGKLVFQGKKTLIGRGPNILWSWTSLRTTPRVHPSSRPCHLPPQHIQHRQSVSLHPQCGVEGQHYCYGSADVFAVAPHQPQPRSCDGPWRTIPPLQEQSTGIFASHSWASQAVQHCKGRGRGRGEGNKYDGKETSEERWHREAITTTYLYMPCIYIYCTNKKFLTGFIAVSLQRTNIYISKNALLHYLVDEKSFTLHAAFNCIKYTSKQLL